MTMLSALARFYARLPNAPKPGYATQRIGVAVELNEDGTIFEVGPLKHTEGKKEVARAMAVPAPVKRTAGVKPNTFWDKTAYALGVTSGADKRTAQEHAAFVDHHRALIGKTDDPGLLAFLRFLDRWTPDQFESHFAEEMKDANVVFALKGERLRDMYLHDRPAAAALLAQDQEADQTFCLVSGVHGPVARLHPSIKGVWGGQSAGGAIVSFNLDAFESYGHSQGENAPISQGAAAEYVGALNYMLPKDSGHRIQIGDTSTVFWAEAPPDADAGDAKKMSEAAFRMMLAEQANEDREENKRVGEALARIRNARPDEALATLMPQVSADVKFYVLGLAPNAARISIRFWLDTTFGALAQNYRRFCQDMAIEPPDRDGIAPLWRYLCETAVQGKRENVPPNLAGEWARAILAGTPYPLTLLNTVLMRIRADGFVNARRASILKALVIRNFRNKEVPVALDPDNRNRGYLLGRLFAVYEQTQSAALGRNVNATIKDKYYGSASSQPRMVFAMLDAGSANHLSKVGKVRPGQKVNLEKDIAGIMDLMVPSDAPDRTPFPATLPAAEQAFFGLGYYHQRSAYFARKDTQAEETAQ